MFRSLLAPLSAPPPGHPAPSASPGDAATGTLLQPQRWRRRTLTTIVGIACAVVVIGLLVWLPTAPVADASLRAGPRLFQVTWVLLFVVTLTQAVLVTLVDRRPALVMVAVASVPLVVVAAPAPAGGLYTLTSIAVLTVVYLATTSSASGTPVTSGASDPPSSPAHPHPGRARPAGAWAAAAAVALGQCLNTARGDELIAGPGLLASAGAGLAQAAVVVGLPLLVGSLVTARRAAEAARTAQVAAVRREQDALLAAAIADQRTAMSRELHDIAAHHLSGIALLAAAIPGQVQTNPGAARHSAELVRQQARAVLEDLRRLVGLLREEADASRPVETLEALRSLVRQRRDSGADVELVLTGPTTARAQQVGPLAQLVAHRMIQEALSNAAAHSPGAGCAVRVDAHDPGALVLTVTSSAVPSGLSAAPAAGAAVVRGGAGAVQPGVGRGRGFGLVGMAERAQLVGADLTYGPTPDNGWQVVLRLPVQDLRDDSTDDSTDATVEDGADGGAVLNAGGELAGTHAGQRDDLATPPSGLARKAWRVSSPSGRPR